MAEVRIVDWLRDGWDLMKEDWVTFVVCGLLVWLIGSQSCQILYGPMMVGYHILCFRKMSCDPCCVSSWAPAITASAPSPAT